MKLISIKRSLTATKMPYENAMGQGRNNNNKLSTLLSMGKRLLSLFAPLLTS